VTGGHVTTRRFRAFDVVIAVETDDESLFSLLDAQLPPFPAVEAGLRAQVSYAVRRAQHGRVAVIRGRRTIATTATIADASERLVADLQTALARLSADRTFVHAGVVAVDDRAVLIPGRSGAGKTTLVAALLRQGAEYLSDEFAVLGPGGDVHPYARHLALRLPGHPFSRMHPAELGATARSTHVPPGAVFFTEFHSSGPTALEVVSPAQAALRLLPHCLGVRARTRQTLASLRALTRRVPSFANTRGDADTMAADVIARVRSQSAV
jgi:hypothetical protein